MSWRQLLAVSRKEIWHILRDRWTLALVLVTPTALLLLMAYALTVDIRQVPLAVLDNDRSAISRAFLQEITAGQDLDLYAQPRSMVDVEELLVQGRIKAALIIGPDFADQLETLEGMPLQVIIDGTEPESGAFAVEHIGFRADRFLRERIADELAAAGVGASAFQAVDLRVRSWYNPNLEPRVDLVPGLISLVLGFPALSVALTLAHEREHGTLEQLMASPIGRVELLLGKMAPYVLVGMANVIFLPALALLWFDVPFHGNFFLFFLLSLPFLLAILSMGIVIGVFMRTQAAALALSFLLIFFPGFFLTGIFFPIVSMPEVMRLEALFLPGTHYAIITRGAFLTGVGLNVLWPYAVMLIGLGGVFTGLAALFFKKRLD